MAEARRASVVIDNYNYGRYLAEAIDSALAQTHRDTEVIVVDDGSTDNSRDVVARYGARVTPVLQENRGMDAALNAGFAASRGEVVLFLDADDVLLPTAVRRAVECLADPGVAKAHWPLWEIDAEGRRTGGIVPRTPLADGDLRAALLEHGPEAYLSPPTSGNAWSRRSLDRVMPIPPEGFRRHAEMYPATVAPVFGTVCAITEPLSCYRVHGANDYATRPADEKHRRNVELYEHRCRALARVLGETGAGDDVRAERWMDGNPAYQWMRRALAAADDLRSVVPAGARFALVDEGQWAERWGPDSLLSARHTVPFPERDGHYAGPPADDCEAIRELDRQRAVGVTHLAIAWPAFWWLDHYTVFRRHLGETCARVLANERVVVFRLEGP